MLSRLVVDEPHFRSDARRETREINRGIFEKVMLPEGWKKEIDETVKQAEARIIVERHAEDRKLERDRLTTAIATPLNSLRDHFQAYIENQDRYESGKRRREIATIAGLLVTAAFTIALVIVGGLQTYAFVASERAFVAPTATNFTNGFVVGENPLQMWIAMRNGGKSVATIEELVVAITHELPPKPEYHTAQKIAFPPILAQDTMRRSVGFVTGWPQPIIDKIASGELKFYIFGVIRYRDDFSWLVPRETGFCFRYIPGSVSGPHVFDTCREPQYTYTR